MSNTQKLVVTRQTTIELTTDEGATPVINLDSLGRQAIESQVQETTLAIEADDAAAAELASVDDTQQFAAIEDVDSYASKVVSDEVSAGLDSVGFGEDFLPWERENAFAVKEAEPEALLK